MTELPAIAFLGPEGTYSHRAALLLTARERFPRRSIRAVFEAVLSGDCTSGVVPGENVFEGAVHETLDLLLVKPLVISGEMVLPIHHHLLGHRGQPVQRVYSHPQALAQCAAWLDEHLPDALRVDCSSTAEAVILAERDPDSAAIGGATRPGVEVLASGLGLSENQTRFFVVSRQPAPETGHDRALVAFLAPHRPGALFYCLRPFAERGINLRRLEHRPARAEAWTYHFIAEIEGHPDSPAVKQAFDALRQDATDVRLLGAWPVPT